MNSSSRYLLLLLLSAVFATPAAAQLDRLRTDADSLFRTSQWKEAAAAYQKITEAEPRNGQAWYRLGISWYSLGRYGEAIPPMQRAVQIGRNPTVMYNLACAMARNGETDSALVWLDRAGASGQFTAEQIEKDEDFTSLRALPRYKEVLANADMKSQPCKGTAEYRQLDFWVGEWTVQVGGQTAGTSSIQRILGDCVILENWTGNGNGSGKSFNVYNAATGKWQQTWVDNRGTVLELSGSYIDDAMRYTGVTQGNGKTVQHRLTFSRVAPDRVRQLWEQSTDDGKTWVASFDGLYVRR
jgi:hypothetical protein